MDQSTAQKELLFAKTLEAVRKRAKEQNNCIAKEQVEQAFAELALSDEQMEMVYQYLHQHKIGVGEQVDLDEFLMQILVLLLVFMLQIQALQTFLLLLTGH